MRKSVHTPEYAALVEELRVARGTAKLSQRELAAQLDVPHSVIAKIESGERRIDVVEFCWFVAECGVDPLPVFARLSRRVIGPRQRPNSKRGRGG